MSAWTLTCDDRRHEFEPIDARHVIVGPHTAHSTCPNCSNHLEGAPPGPADPETSGGERG